MAGKMMTIADSTFFPIDFPLRAARRTPGNFTTVPISLSPAPSGPDRPSGAFAGSWEIERRKVNGLLRRAGFSALGAPAPQAGAAMARPRPPPLGVAGQPHDGTDDGAAHHID